MRLRMKATKIVSYDTAVDDAPGGVGMEELLFAGWRADGGPAVSGAHGAAAPSGAAGMKESAWNSEIILR
ncbi:hypothetical protein BTJ39_23205 [Izhakiella australiensis]|uniref:Uncharacterized protein n=1 Tax=Izhakiella australiensis TaxID=1926881 RepID=A0A1S8Y743_9GAMM|nr:hypothetical protein BTJ39_23205 [Izhakiella australiensis]